MGSASWVFDYDSYLDSDNLGVGYCATTPIVCGQTIGGKGSGTQDAIARKDFSGTIPGDATITKAWFVIVNPSQINFALGKTFRLSESTSYTWDDDPCPTPGQVTYNDGVSDDSVPAGNAWGVPPYTYYPFNCKTLVEHAIASHSSMFSCYIRLLDTPLATTQAVWPSVEATITLRPFLYIEWTVAGAAKTQVIYI